MQKGNINWVIYVTHYFYDDACNVPDDGPLVGTNNRILRFSTEAQAEAYLTDKSQELTGRGPKNCDPVNTVPGNLRRMGFHYSGIYSLKPGEYSRAVYKPEPAPLYAATL